MNEQALQDYVDMWGKDKEWYVLRDRGNGAYSIVDMRSNAVVIIENTEVAREVVRRMLDAGVVVGDPFDLRFRKEMIRRRIGRGTQRTE